MRHTSQNTLSGDQILLENSEQNQLNISVNDNGISLENRAINHMHDQSSQALQQDCSPDSKKPYTKGIGLGLSICRKIVTFIGKNSDIVASTTKDGTRLEFNAYVINTNGIVEEKHYSSTNVLKAPSGADKPDDKLSESGCKYKKSDELSENDFEFRDQSHRPHDPLSHIFDDKIKSNVLVPVGGHLSGPESSSPQIKHKNKNL